MYTFEAHFIRPGHPYVVMPATGVPTTYADVPTWPTGASEGSGWTLVYGEFCLYRLAGAYLLPPDEKRKIKNGRRREMVPAGAFIHFPF